MTDEIIKSNGRLDLFEIAKRKDGTPITGKKADGTPYTNYKYKIGGKYFSGFIKLSEFDTPVELGDYVIVAYTTAPNPKNKDKPYKNIVNITQAKEPEVTDEEMAEEDAKVNAVPVGEPTPPKEIEETINEYNFGAFFGMISNQTESWMEHKEKMGYKITDESFPKDWDKAFERFWKINIEKRKEKLK